MLGLKKQNKYLRIWLWCPCGLLMWKLISRHDFVLCLYIVLLFACHNHRRWSFILCIIVPYLHPSNSHARLIRTRRSTLKWMKSMPSKDLTAGSEWMGNLSSKLCWTSSRNGALCSSNILLTMSPTGTNIKLQYVNQTLSSSGEVMSH